MVKVNLVRALVVMFWRVENTLICIINTSAFDGGWAAFRTLSVFVKIRPRWNVWVSFFKKVHQKGLFGVEKENSNFRFLTADSRKLQTVALKTEA